MDTPHPLPRLNARQSTILALIREHGGQSIADLSDRFGVATQTIRRDINELCERGLARRVHGGVAPVNPPANAAFAVRQALNESAKRAIGQAAAALIPSGATVFLGVGTTVRFTAEALIEKPDMTVVTNNLEIALMLCAASSHAVHVAGGELRGEDRDMTGPATLAAYERVRADIAVIGAGALDPAHGVLDHKRFDADLGALMIRQARQSLLVADHSKWSIAASHIVAPFAAFDHIVTDAAPAPSARLEPARLCLAAPQRAPARHA